MRLTQITKESMKYAIYGCLGELGRRLHTAAVPIITYHSLDASGSTMSMPVEEFDRQMRYLQQNGFSAITLSELVDSWTSGNPIDERSFVLTFDDGFRSVYESAFPLLQELGFTATIFPITGFVGQTCGWDIGPRNRGIGAERLELMSWPQIHEMCKHGFEFGSHGVRHLHLPDEPADVVRVDLVQSRRELEDRLGRPCRLFCYPYGQFSDATRHLVAEAGYEAAVTLRFGWNDATTDRFELRRIGSACFTNLQVLKASMYQMYGWHLRSRNGHR